jgi:hypothetical protein
MTRLEFESYRIWYTQEVIEKVTELLKLSYSTESGFLEFSNNEDGGTPFIRLMFDPDPRSCIQVRGNNIEDGEEKEWIQPSRYETWEFLECCEKALEKCEQLK